MNRSLTCVVVVAVFLAGSGAARGAQSLSFSAGAAGTFVVPTTPVTANIHSLRVEFRMHNFSAIQAGWAPVYDLNSFTASFVPGAQAIYVSDWADSLDGGDTSFVFDWTKFNSDIVVRFQRDADASQLTLEVWNSDGSNYSMQTIKITALGTARIDGPRSMGGAASMQLAYLRIYSTVLAPGTPPSVQPGDIGAWDFEGDGTDSSPSDSSIAVSGAVFVPTPTVPPVADPGVERTVRAGKPFTLDASKSWSAAGNAITGYVWQQLSGPSTLQFDPGSGITSAGGAVFGQYSMRLTVIDQQGLSSSKDVDIGAVATDSNGVVIPSDPNVDFIFGPQIMLGMSPWPYLDDRHKFMADFFGKLQDQSPQYTDTWTSSLAGSIMVAPKGTVVTGLGTDFQNDFCGGGTNPATPEMSIVVWFPDGSGGTAKRDYPIAQCNSATSISLALAYGATSTALSGAQYSKLTDVGAWINGSNNNNYYDVVMAFYSLYYRSGLTKYLNYAHTLADRWWTQPRIDQMNICLVGLDTGPRCPAPRQRSLTGILWRAYDGQPSYWPKLYAFFDGQLDGMSSSQTIADIREDAYGIAHMAVAAKLSPDPVKAAVYAGAVSAAITNRWAPQQQPRGEWVNPTYGFSSWNLGTGTVSLANGSTAVTGSGTNFSAQDCNGAPFWVPEDPVAYRATYISATQLTLDRPYEGQTRGGAGWECNNLAGKGTQPFMMGVVGHAWSYVYQVTGDARAKQFSVDAAKWLSTYGINAGGRVLYYGRVYPNCEPNPDAEPECAGSGRFLQAEVPIAFSAGYLNSSDTVVRNKGDQLVGAMLGTLGGPFSDGQSADEFASADITISPKAKNFGFPFGFGGASSWPAARLGGAQPPDIRTVQIPFDPSLSAIGISLNLIVTQPDGTKTVVSCATAACGVSYDARLGSSALEIDYVWSGRPYSTQVLLLEGQ